MRILLTGAAGIVGTLVRPLLIERGYALVSVDLKEIDPLENEVALQTDVCDAGRVDERRVHTWCSPRDLVDFFEIGLTRDGLGHRVVYGQSDNPDPFVDNATAAQIGFQPRARPPSAACRSAAWSGSGPPRRTFRTLRPCRIFGCDRRGWQYLLGMKKYIYLGLAVVGIVLPMSQFIPASVAGEFTVSGMFAEMTATRTITGVSFDFLVATVTALVFGVYEAVRLKLKLAWISLVGTFLIGVSFGLPFFLYLREREIGRGDGYSAATPRSM